MTMDLELDINSASQKMHRKDSRREPDEARDSQDDGIVGLGAGSFPEYSP
jgi:hypothetical protein